MPAERQHCHQHWLRQTSLLLLLPHLYIILLCVAFEFLLCLNVRKIERRIGVEWSHRKSFVATEPQVVDGVVNIGESTISEPASIIFFIPKASKNKMGKQQQLLQKPTIFLLVRIRGVLQEEVRDTKPTKKKN